MIEPWTYQTNMEDHAFENGPRLEIMSARDTEIDSHTAVTEIPVIGEYRYEMGSS